MVLNYIWIAFFLIAFVVALCKLAIGGDTEVFTHIINASFASAKTGFEISLGLTGVLALWLGIMKIGEKGGVIQAFARLTAPVFSKLFPGIPKDHPATGSIFMCISANLLGLDNADGAESHERVAGAEHAEGFSQRSDDHVPLHQCFGTDTDSGLHHDLPGTDGSDKPG